MIFLDCNEAPDSRSLVQYLETGEPSEEVQRKPIMTHANIRGVNASLRKKEFKYVPGTKELYNLSFDPATKHVRFLFFIFFQYFKNLYYKEDKQDLLAHMDS